MNETMRDQLMSAAASAVGNAYEAGYDDAADVAYNTGYNDGLERGRQEMADLLNLTRDAFEGALEEGDEPEGCGECPWCTAEMFVQRDPREFIALTVEFAEETADELDQIAEVLAEVDACFESVNKAQDWFDNWAETVEERLELLDADSAVLASLEERLAAVEAVTTKYDDICPCGDPACGSAW